MGTWIAIEQGRRPWHPASDVEVVETLHHYDMPLIGVLAQGGSLFLFRCVEGHLEPSHLWAYTRLEPDELDALREVTDPEALHEKVKVLSVGRPTVVAMAHDDTGIAVSALVENPGAHETLAHAALFALRAASDALDQTLGHPVA